MKYLLSIYGNDEIWSSFSPEEFAELVAATDAHNQAMVATGELLFACGVADQADAKRVRSSGSGTTVVTDGPYIETKEYLGSFYIVECDSLERAQELAAQMPSARHTDIEIRALLHGGSPDDL
ncbi:MAG: hypothetical protein GX868_11655 [Actinobacteria bacterium]|nr:hypothetical protein [Actinomycetota bacterium]